MKSVPSNVFLGNPAENNCCGRNHIFLSSFPVIFGLLANINGAIERDGVRLLIRILQQVSSPPLFNQDTFRSCPDYGGVHISEGVVLSTGFNGVQLGDEDVSLLERCPLLGAPSITDCTEIDTL